MVERSSKVVELVMSQLNAEGVGLEIAPYFDPFLSKANGRVLFTDYIGTEAIREKASANPDLAKRPVPEIDFVWAPGRALKDCAPEGLLVDYVVASHVMEHVPNPLGWLNQILAVTKVGGRLALFLPERSLNADFFRQETSFYHLVQWWIEQPSVPTPGQVLDFMSHSIMNPHGQMLAWSSDGTPPPDTERAYSDAEALDNAIFVHNEEVYKDIHCTVWNHATFAAIMERCVACGLINVSLSSATPNGPEFCCILTKQGEPAVLPPDVRRRQPLAATDSARLENAVHQLNVLRHDLGFLIAMVDTLPARLASQAGEATPG